MSGAASSFHQPEQPDRSEAPPRAITLDDLFRIAYFHGGRVSLMVLGGHETRHVVSYENLLYELESPTDRRLLLDLAAA